MEPVPNGQSAVGWKFPLPVTQVFAPLHPAVTATSDPEPAENT
jgi:hypothetical protein